MEARVAIVVALVFAVVVIVWGAFVIGSVAGGLVGMKPRAMRTTGLGLLGLLAASALIIGTNDRVPWWAGWLTASVVTVAIAVLLRRPPTS